MELTDAFKYIVVESGVLLIISILVSKQGVPPPKEITFFSFFEI